eukprot:4568483-Pyramimonas_sp.AAC.1
MCEGSRATMLDTRLALTNEQTRVPHECVPSSRVPDACAISSAHRTFGVEAPAPTCWTPA